MKKFLILYCMPSAGMQEWMKKSEEERKAAEDKMRAEWAEWAAAHASSLVMTAGAGKDKRVTSSGVADVSNDIMLFSIVQAETQDAAAALFVGHPHLAIPDAWIEVMPANDVPGMAKGA